MSDIQNIAWAIPLIFFGVSIGLWCICCCVCCYKSPRPPDYTVSPVSSQAPIQAPSPAPFSEDPG